MAAVQRDRNWILGAIFEQADAASAAGELDAFRADPDGFRTPQVVVQRDEAWLDTASPEQIDAAHRAGELHRLQGGQVEVDGWPLDNRGRRIELPDSGS